MTSNKHTRMVLAKLRAEKVHVLKDPPSKIKEALGNTVTPNKNINTALDYRAKREKQMCRTVMSNWKLQYKGKK